MYVGHAAIALALKSRAPRVALVPLALACYGPDWIDVALMIPRPREGMASYSHSLPAVIIGALVASGLYALVVRRPGATMLLTGWLLHWPADVLTGRKPLIGLHQLVGLDLYHVAPFDFAIESALVVGGCMLYWRATAQGRQHGEAQVRRFAQEDKPRRRVVVALGVALILLQLGFDMTIARIDGLPWRPSLANDG